MLPPLATVLPAAASRCPIRSVISARTCRSTAVRRPPYPSCCHRGRGKKPSPGPTAPSLFPLPESSITPWLLRCLRALAVATLAVAFSAPSLLQAAPASSVGERSPLDATAYDCEDVGRYYAGLDGRTGDELRTELAAVVSPHAALRYKDVWEALKILDAAVAEHPEASSEVIEIYSQRAVSKLLAGKPDGWNREHLWPRSYGLTYGPSLTDLHNIRPADVNVNSSRGNKYYGECSATSVRCVRPANQEAAPDTEMDTEKWAPPFQVRGDIARSLMYMAVSYGSSQNDGTPHLEISESPNIQFANLIWTNPLTETSTFIGESQQSWVNEFHYENKGKDKNEFVELVVRMPFDAKELMLVLYNGANGKMYRSLNLADKEAFTVTEISSDYLLYTVCTPLQNGPADGIALVYYRYNREAEVLQFLSYEGSMRAQDGPAKGMVSTDIMLKETDESSDQDSLGLGGQKIGEFAWRKMVGNATPGKLNAEQTF
ncbi:uncharacterized protein [Miscanthus floridulus]|uniref:uncharacterized protein isoform X3 n=1 Tax=Miscanthus floridulus TaxID=154761 RepID=UPI003457A04F